MSAPADPIDLDRLYMRMALNQAVQAGEEGEVPIGAVIVHAGRLIGRARNQVETLRDPTAHAEVLAITQAAQALGDWRLEDCTLYVTKEPCPMCAGAIVNARVPRVVWGVSDPRRGGAASRFPILQSDCLNHRCAYAAGVLEAECRDVLKAFFRDLRAESEN
jgi:tRNA(adenine34) deaminase